MTRIPDDGALLADAIEIDAWRAMIAAMPREVAAHFGFEMLDVSSTTLFVARSIPVGMFNRAIGIGDAATPTDAEVDETIAFAHRLGAPTLWIQAITDSPLATLLADRGVRLSKRRSWAKMLHGGKIPTIATDLRIEPLEASHHPALAHVLLVAHGLPFELSPWIEAIASATSFRAYGAFDDDRLVSGGVLYEGPLGAWLGFGGTLPDARGRGAQGAIMERRIRDARAAGHQAIATETSEPIGDDTNPSLSNMRRCGFDQVSSRLNFVAY